MEKIKITNINNETGNITADPADSKRIIREYYKQKFDILDKLYHFLKKDKLLQPVPV